MFTKRQVYARLAACLKAVAGLVTLSGLAVMSAMPARGVEWITNPFDVPTYAYTAEFALRCLKSIGYPQGAVISDT